jgi:hypothetical protein
MLLHESTNPAFCILAMIKHAERARENSVSSTPQAVRLNRPAAQRDPAGLHGRLGGTLPWVQKGRGALSSQLSGKASCVIPDALLGGREREGPGM